MSEIISSVQPIVWNERSRFSDIRHFEYDKTQKQLKLVGHNVLSYQWTPGRSPNEMLSVDPDGGPNIEVHSIMTIPPTGELVRIEKIVSVSKDSKTKVFTAVFRVQSIQ